MAPAGKNKNIRGIIAACIALAALTGLFIYDAAVNAPEYSNSEIAMGTVVTQDLKGYDAEKTAAEIFNCFNSLEYNRLSWRAADSDIAKINAAGTAGYTAGENTAEWLNKTLDVCAGSAGALDITVGRLSALWDIGGANQKLPPQSEIDALLGPVGWEKVKIQVGSVSLGDGQSLDMGAVGKGIACDEAFKILEKSKITSAVISVGGSILLYGQKDEIRVGIRDPKGGANDYMGVLNLKNCCVSTSGDYEKVFTVNGKKYHHILNPKTGYPADSGLTSVTVVCESGLTSDALSTACFVLGYEKSLPLLEKYNAEAVFITQSNTVMATGGLAGKFEITNSDYTGAFNGALQ